MVQKTSIVKSLEKTWKSIERLLQKNGFKTTILESDRALRRFIYDSIPDNCIVGLGNSLSTSALKIRDILLEKGNKVYYNWNGTTQNRIMDTYEEQPRPDFFLTMAETITDDGKIINNEYSSEAISKHSYPKNIIAFSKPDKLSKKVTQAGLSTDFTILSHKPYGSEVTVVLMPFASAS